MNLMEEKLFHHPSEIIRKVTESLSSGRSLVLATVISRAGSGPREPGAMMAILEREPVIGTVGGGILEDQVLTAAGKTINNGQSLLCHFFLTGERAAEGEMICGGRMEVLVQYLDAAAHCCPDIFQKILTGWKKGVPLRLVRSIEVTRKIADRKSGAAEHVETGLGLLEGDRLERGSLDISGFNAKWIKESCVAAKPLLKSSRNVHYFFQPLPPPDTVFIFGAGHIGKELAILCAPIGFRTVVVDDRNEFANAGRFPSSDMIVLVDSFRDCLSGLNIGDNDYIVIVTRGHAHDQAVLALALRTRARYIGMIASRRKRDVTYGALRSKGFSDRDLQRVHSPIGLAIGAQTPAEIALSIAAELISVRSESSRPGEK